MPSLYDRLGGAPAIEAAVDNFYRRVLSDDRIAHFFDDIDMDLQAAKQKAFLTMAFGGPHAYTGRDMRAAHLRLIVRGLDDSHVDAVVENIIETLKELQVSESDIAEVVKTCESVRDDV